MEEEFLLILLAVKRLDRTAKNRGVNRNLRDKNNPFTIKDSKFEKCFGLPKLMCRKLIKELQPFDTQNTTLPFGARFFATLFFYANGFYQKNVGKYKLSPMSQSSVSRTVHYMTNLIIQRKQREVTLPYTNEEQQAIKNGFFQKFGIENTLGVVGCTQIGIRKPSANESHMVNTKLYLNESGFNSLHVEAVCNHEMHFMSLCANFPGSHEPAQIWHQSAARSFIMKYQKTIGWFLGSKNYALEPWLMTPIEANPINAHQDRYNEKHKKAHQVLSKAFMLLKSRFRCLAERNVLYYSHESAANIIKACVILHNAVLREFAPCQADIDILLDDEVNDTTSISTSIESEFKEVAQLVQSRYIESLLLN